MRPLSELHEFLSRDHARLDALLETCMRAGEDWQASYDEFRRRGDDDCHPERERGTWAGVRRAAAGDDGSAPHRPQAPRSRSG